MTREEYIADVKTRFGDQRSKDGMLIRDMEDSVLLKKMLDRYPADRDEIDDLEVEETETLTEVPQTDIQKQLKEQKKGFLERVGDSFRERVDTASDEIIEDQNPIRKGIRVLGQGAGFVGDIASEAISSIPGADTVIEKTGEAIAETPIAQKGAELYGDFKENNPEFAEDVEDVVGITSVVPGAKLLGKGIQKGLDKAPTALAKIEEGLENRKLGKAEAEEEELLNYVTPKPQELTPTEYEKALSRGRITPKTTTDSAKYNLSETEKAVAKKYKEIIDPDPVKTSINIYDKVSKLDDEVGNFLAQNNGIFNKGELKNKLMADLEEVDDITISPERVGTAKQNIVDNFVTKLEKNDMHSLWEARKEFDRTIENAFRGSPTMQKEMKVKFRNAIQDFISEGTPDGEYKAFMKDMSNLLRLQETVATKASKQRGLDAIQLWLKEHPKTVKTIGIGTGLGGASFLLQ